MSKLQHQKNQGNQQKSPLLFSPQTIVATSDNEIIKIIEFSTKRDYEHWYPRLIEEIEKSNKLYQEKLFYKARGPLSHRINMNHLNLFSQTFRGKMQFSENKIISEKQPQVLRLLYQMRMAYFFDLY